MFFLFQQEDFKKRNPSRKKGKRRLAFFLVYITLSEQATYCYSALEVSNEGTKKQYVATASENTLVMVAK